MTRTALWVVPVADLGGVARHVIDVVRHGIPGWEVAVLCPEGPLAQRIRRADACVVTGAFGPAAGALTSLRSLWRSVRDVRPALVHSHLAYADILVAATPLPRATLRVTTEHGIAGDVGQYHRSRFEAQLMARVHRVRLRRFDGAIAVSEATRAAMVDVWGARRPIEVIRNGVDAPAGGGREVATDQAGPRVLSLARLAPEKRIDALIGAFALVRRARPGATLTVAGIGPLEQRLRQQTVAVGVGDAVRFCGFVDPDLAMREADVLAQLSVWENCSYSILDAAARGLGVVASDVGGNPEIVAPTSLVDADDPRGVAEAIIRATRTRPAPPDWTVGQMCDRIGATYDRVSR